jgi:6-pyruvoyltetrahydropterin/6-carboxytetrahydropterin synthase
MNATIFKRFWLECAHSLPDYPALHGHTYQVEVWLKGEVLHGYVVHDSQLTEWTEQVRQHLDHCHLNTMMDYPTSENIAIYIWHYFQQLLDQATSQPDVIHHPALHKVRIWRESVGLGVEYGGE